ncbi:hypothetical protein Q5P01_000731 [Channa striata]|uniref:Uncharacterized protein n=1 Tax=Channa striata TaxID=64152 RepID=A0AA88IGG6_CHASR|nr:hypothetical protein Q5P01_000731 [Channa striata]
MKKPQASTVSVLFVPQWRTSRKVEGRQRAPERHDPLVLECLRSMGMETYHRATFRHTEFLDFIGMPRERYEAYGDGFSRRYTELLKKIAALCESAFGLRGNALPPGSAAGTEEGEGPRVAAGDDPAEGAASRRASRFDKWSCDEENATDATPPLIHCTEIPDHVNPEEEYAQVYCCHPPGTCHKSVLWM